MRKRRPIQDPKTLNLVPSEYEECKTFWAYAQLIPITKEFLIKNCNEGLDGWFRNALIRIGLRTGLLDYHFVPDNKKYKGLWIEMKRRDGQLKPRNKDQEDWIAKLNKIGHYACYAYGCDEAIRIVNLYITDQL